MSAVVFCYIGNYLPLPMGEVAERSEDGEDLPLPLGEVAKRSEDGEGLPLPMGEVAERSEDGEGEGRAGPLSHLR